jgi:hypothetical protein
MNPRSAPFSAFSQGSDYREVADEAIDLPYEQSPEYDRNRNYTFKAVDWSAAGVLERPVAR